MRDPRFRGPFGMCHPDGLAGRHRSCRERGRVTTPDPPQPRTPAPDIRDNKNPIPALSMNYRPLETSLQDSRAVAVLVDEALLHGPLVNHIVRGVASHCARVTTTGLGCTRTRA